jgi:hypothetical protein
MIVEDLKHHWYRLEALLVVFVQDACRNTNRNNCTIQACQLLQRAASGLVRDVCM